ncbi:MAG TPA: squalene/phytoene synthase family protein [Rhizomicrobium sp.]|jgi:phytoene synthase|nr:squalene/phytoene synthase family protein [Rhizomicrobium sp.]
MIADLVRKSDPDRYLAALFAPAAKRPLLHALYAFNIEIARVADTVREPMMGEIRLEWWRETLDGARAGRPRNHDVARALAALFAATALPTEPFDAMIDARTFDASSAVFPDRAAVEAYCDATSGNLMRLAAMILGAPDDAMAREAGTAYALAGIVRSIPHHAARHKTFLPQSLMQAAGLAKDALFIRHERDRVKAVVAQMALWANEHLAAARRLRVPRETLPAYLPAAIAPLFLSRVTRTGFDPTVHAHEIAIHRRQVRLLAAAMRRRI